MINTLAPAAHSERRLSVVMPVYNEERTVTDCLDRVCESPHVREIILVDDGSRDRSVEILREYINHSPETSISIRLLQQPSNRGKGAAVRRGLAEAVGPYVIVQDADLEYDPSEYARLLKPLDNGLADVVYGSRFAGGDAHRVLFFWHSMGNKFLTVLSNMFTDMNLTDMETCYKVFRVETLRSILPYLTEDRFGFEPEVTSLVGHGRFRVFEVGISYNGRTYDEGKKIGWRDGVRAVYCIVKFGLRKQVPLAVPGAASARDQSVH